VLLDLVKAFETIPHQHILDAAKKHHCNLWVLRLSLSAYRVPRTVVVDGVCSTPQTATQGITAGSGFATDELACLLLDVCDELKEAYPSLDLSEYVDDLTIGQAGPGWWVADILASATEFVIDILQVRLQLSVSATKSAVVGSTSKLARTVATKIRSGIVKAADHAKILGTATTSGRARCTKLLQSRLKSTKAKGKRARNLKRSGVNSSVWAATAGLTGMLYGAEVTGVATTMLHQQRSAICSAAHAQNAGRNPLMALWVHDCEVRKLDPSFLAHELPVLHYAKACYEQWLPANTINTTCSQVQEALEAAEFKCNAAKGPIAATILTLKRIGWSLEDGHTMVTDTGATLNLTVDSPAFVVDQVTQAVRRKIGSEIDVSLPFLQAKGRGPVRSGVRRLLRAKKNSHKSHALWKSKHRGDLRSAVNNGQWPQVRLHKAQVVDSNVCKLCNLAVGTLAHRHECVTTAPARGACTVDWDCQKLVASLSVGARHLLATRGLLACADLSRHPPSEDGVPDLGNLPRVWSNLRR